MKKQSEQLLPPNPEQTPQSDPYPHKYRYLFAALIPLLAVVICICLLTLQRSDTAPTGKTGHTSSSVSAPVSSPQSTPQRAPAELPPQSDTAGKPLAAVNYPRIDTNTNADTYVLPKTDLAFRDAYRNFAFDSAGLIFQETLSGRGNGFYSPASLFMTAAMLSECTGGESQKELLSLLGVSGTAMLQKNMGSFFENCYFQSKFLSKALIGRQAAIR